MPMFSWDEANLQHIGRHGVSREEAEFVVIHAAAPFPRRTRDGRWLVWGATPRRRLLQVVFAKLALEQVDPPSVDLFELDLDSDSPVVRLVHARDLTIAEKHQFRRFRRGSA